MKSASWHGRLALRLAANAASQMPDQSFSAGFELTGDAQQGELMLFNPLGSTVAAIQWTPARALLQANGELREFNDLGQLLDVLLGTPIPVAALFDWLAGMAADVDGWQVDLSLHSQGKILARRLSPVPAAELRVLLDD